MTGDLAELRLSQDDALFLDFDGTLTEIGPDPDAIWLEQDARDALSRLATALAGAVVLISGRDLRDLAARTPARLWRAGGHGLEIVAPEAPLPPPPPPPPAAILAPLHAVAERPGLRVEIKGPVAALHYREAPEAQSVCYAAARQAAAAVPDHVWQAGKMVVEVKPARAHKGRTLRRLAATPPFSRRRPIMIGDDTTDEDAIAEAQDLGGLGVKVGEGVSVAKLRAADPAAVRAWLAGEATRLA